MQKRPKIGIIISTTRPGRFGEVPTYWLFNIAKERNDADFEIVDLRDYPMPFFEEKVPLHVAPPRPAARQPCARPALRRPLAPGMRSPNSLSCAVPCRPQCPTSCCLTSSHLDVLDTSLLID